MALMSKVVIYFIDTKSIGHGINVTLHFFCLLLWVLVCKKYEQKCMFFLCHLMISAYSMGIIHFQKLSTESGIERK